MSNVLALNLCQACQPANSVLFQGHKAHEHLIQSAQKDIMHAFT